MRALYQHPTEAQLEEVVQEVENGHGGKVDFPEFIEILVSQSSDKLSFCFSWMLTMTNFHEYKNGHLLPWFEEKLEMLR